MTDRARFDQNLRPSLIGVSSSDGATPVSLWVDPTSHELLISVNSGLTPGNYDYVAVAYPTATQEVYSFYQGGSGGTLVATLTINYVDNTKEQILNAART